MQNTLQLAQAVISKSSDRPPTSARFRNATAHVGCLKNVAQNFSSGVKRYMLGVKFVVDGEGDIYA